MADAMPTSTLPRIAFGHLPTAALISTLLGVIFSCRDANSHALLKHAA